MLIELTGRYTGNLGTLVVHGPSGATLRTAAPVDNQGDGSTFSPTDLATAALATCMMTLMAIRARDQDIDLTGLTFAVQKHMADDPRRISGLPVIFQMPPGLSEEDRRLLEDAASGCPVCHSLNPKIERSVSFQYPDSPAQDTSR